MSEVAVVRAVQAAAQRGCVVIIVAHRPALILIADQIVRIGADGVKITLATASNGAPNTTAITGAGW